ESELLVEPSPGTKIRFISITQKAKSSPRGGYRRDQQDQSRSKQRNQRRTLWYSFFGLGV
ncbi:hypothetical protein M514_13624, partial [Trichuris suis]